MRNSPGSGNKQRLHANSLNRRSAPPPGAAEGPRDQWDNDKTDMATHCHSHKEHLFETALVNITNLTKSPRVNTHQSFLNIDPQLDAQVRDNALGLLGGSIVESVFTVQILWTISSSALIAWTQRSELRS
jgi:hypothetical protein